MGFGISLLTSRRSGAALGRGCDLGGGQSLQLRHVQQPLRSWAPPATLRSTCSPSASASGAAGGRPGGAWPRGAAAPSPPGPRPPLQSERPRAGRRLRCRTRVRTATFRCGHFAPPRGPPRAGRRPTRRGARRVCRPRGHVPFAISVFPGPGALADAEPAAPSNARPFPAGSWAPAVPPASAVWGSATPTVINQRVSEAPTVAPAHRGASAPPPGRWPVCLAAEGHPPASRSVPAGRARGSAA